MSDRILTHPYSRLLLATITASWFYSPTLGLACAVVTYGISDKKSLAPSTSASVRICICFRGCLDLSLQTAYRERMVVNVDRPVCLGGLWHICVRFGVFDSCQGMSVDALWRYFSPSSWLVSCSTLVIALYRHICLLLCFCTGVVLCEVDVKC
jgi:phosphate/sulfate permease